MQLPTGGRQTSRKDAPTSMHCHRVGKPRLLAAPPVHRRISRLGCGHNDTCEDCASGQHSGMVTQTCRVVPASTAGPVSNEPATRRRPQSTPHTVALAVACRHIISCGLPGSTAISACTIQKCPVSPCQMMTYHVDNAVGEDEQSCEQRRRAHSACMHTHASAAQCVRPLHRHGGTMEGLCLPKTRLTSSRWRSASQEVCVCTAAPTRVKYGPCMQQGGGGANFAGRPHDAYLLV